MLASAYMRAVRNAGATLRTRTSALAAVRSGGRIVGVETTRGRIECEWLVDAAGTWAGDVLRWFDVELAASPIRLEIAHRSPLSGTGRTSCCPGRRAYTADELH